MMKARKICIAICTVIFAAAGLWFYWEKPIPLGDQLPEEAWVKMELEQMLPRNPSGDIAFEEVPMEDILRQIQILRVTRAEENRLLDDECFRITLHKEKAWPTVIYVGSTGRIHVAVDMQFDDWKNYEGGEALYVYLSNLSETLNVASPVT